MVTEDTPFPDYTYTTIAADRADKGQAAARRAFAALDDQGLFDTEPALLAKTLARLSKGDDA